MGEEAERAGVSINSILQNKITDKNDVNTVMTTDKCKKSQVDAFADAISKYEWCHERPLVFPFLA